MEKARAARTRGRVLRTFDWQPQTPVHRCGRCAYKSPRRYDVAQHRFRCLHYQHALSKFAHLSRKEMGLRVGPVKRPIPLNFLAKQYRGGRKPLEKYVCAICNGLEFSTLKQKTNHMRRHKKGRVGRVLKVTHEEVESEIA